MILFYIEKSPIEQYVKVVGYRFQQIIIAHDILIRVYKVP